MLGLQVCSPKCCAVQVPGLCSLSLCGQPGHLHHLPKAMQSSPDALISPKQVQEDNTGTSYPPALLRLALRQSWPAQKHTSKH